MPDIDVLQPRLDWVLQWKGKPVRGVSQSSYRILAQHHDGLKRCVNYLGTKADKGLVSIGLGDWAPRKTSFITMLRIACKDGSQATIITDGKWRVADHDEAGWQTLCYENTT